MCGWNTADRENEQNGKNDFCMESLNFQISLSPQLISSMQSEWARKILDFIFSHLTQITHNATPLASSLFYAQANIYTERKQTFQNTSVSCALKTQCRVSPINKILMNIIRSDATHNSTRLTGAISFSKSDWYEHFVVCVCLLSVRTSSSLLHSRLYSSVQSVHFHEILYSWKVNCFASVIYFLRSILIYHTITVYTEPLWLKNILSFKSRKNE